MGSRQNLNPKVFHISSNIVLSVDDNNMGDMYVYDGMYGYILNGATAGDLVDYFAYEDKIPISEEILDICMNMTINKGTH